MDLHIWSLVKAKYGCRLVEHHLVLLMIAVMLKLGSQIARKMAAFPVSWRGKSCHFYCKVIPNILTSNYSLFIVVIFLVSKYKMQQKQYITSSMLFKQVHCMVTCFSLSSMATWSLILKHSLGIYGYKILELIFRIRTVHSFSRLNIRCRTRKHEHFTTHIVSPSRTEGILLHNSETLPWDTKSWNSFSGSGQCTAFHSSTCVKRVPT